LPAFAQNPDALDRLFSPDLNEGRFQDAFDSLDVDVCYAGSPPYGRDCIAVYPQNRLVLDGRELFSGSIESTVNLLAVQGKRIEIGTDVVIPGLGMILCCDDFNLFKHRPPTHVTMHHIGMQLSGCFGEPKKIINPNGD
jgi:hypothetical protein